MVESVILEDSAETFLLTGPNYSAMKSFCQSRVRRFPVVRKIVLPLIVLHLRLRRVCFGECTKPPWFRLVWFLMVGRGKNGRSIKAGSRAWAPGGFLSVSRKTGAVRTGQAGARLAGPHVRPYGIALTPSSAHQLACLDRPTCRRGRGRHPTGAGSAACNTWSKKCDSGRAPSAAVRSLAMVFGTPMTP